MKILEKLAARQNGFFEHRPVVIACLGDSVTHGCFEVFINEAGKVDTCCRAEEAYPALLRRELGDMYPFSQPCVLNAGASGDSAANGRKRLRRDALFMQPDLVIVDFGLNDSMAPDVEAGLRRYETAMRGILTDIRETGAEAILLTPNFMCSYVSHNLAEETLRDIAAQAAKVQNGGILESYVNAAKKTADEMNVPVADAYGVWKKMANAGADTTRMLANHINHPTPEAHTIFLREIMRAMLEN